MTMKKMWVWMVLTLFTLVGEWHGRCYGCLEEEIIGLLEIKSSIDPDGYGLENWVDTSNQSISNCCEWEGVECDGTTRRVVQLALGGARDVRDNGDLVLNASLFLPFKELRSLYLRSNAIVGCHENQGFEVLSSRLKKLENLDLGHNELNDDSSMLSCFTGLSSLKSLDLSENMLTASTGVKFLSSRLKKLENLDLSWNQYDDSIFSSLTGFSSLKSLDLSGNELTGSSVGFYGGVEVLSSQLRKLERLDLSYNSFNDTILPHLCGFSSLKTLNLSSNMVSGSTTCIIGLRKLEVLSLNELTITGSTLLQSLGALPSLKILSLQETNLSSTSISQVTFFNTTTLEELYLDGSALPINFLQNIGRQLPSLKILSVRDCDLTGTLPTQGLDGLKNVEQLDLSENKLEGSLPHCLGNLSSLQVLDVSRNRFTGNIATGPLNNLISLEFLSLSNNLFELPLSFKSFSNHSKLKFFICDNCTLVEDRAGSQNFIPKFQLMLFSLSNSISKAINSDVPMFLYRGSIFLYSQYASAECSHHGYLRTTQDWKH